MQIAEELVRDGMTSGHEFAHKLTEFVYGHAFTKIIETGTYQGMGTTKAILNGLSGDYKFISIEVNPNNFRIAKNNLKGFKGLHLINGLSVGKEDLPDSIPDEFPDYIAVDHQPANRLKLYCDDVNHNVRDHALNMALASFDFKPEFVLLDSAGHMGFIEFKYLMQRVKGSFYLALDDTNHIKHYDTVQWIEQSAGFTEVYSTDDKFGSKIYHYDGI